MPRPENGASNDNASQPYRNMTLAPKVTIIHRTSYSNPVSPTSPSSGPGGSDSIGRRQRLTAEILYGVRSVPGAALAAVSSSGVHSMRESREKEKVDLQELNERFTDYIDKVRLLEEQNRKLAEELARLKERWGKETTAVKAMYQSELDDARKALDAAEKDKARLEIRCTSLEDEIEELTKALTEANKQVAQNSDKFEKQEAQLSEYETSVAVLRKKAESLENERDRDKQEIARLQQALSKTRNDLDEESLNHVDAENRGHSLEEEIEFMKQLHEKEMAELSALVYSDTAPENRDYWKNELAQALQEIRGLYDDKMGATRGEIEANYKTKIDEFRAEPNRGDGLGSDTASRKEEVTNLRGQQGDLRDKLSQLESKNAQLEKQLNALRRDYDAKEKALERENQQLKEELGHNHGEMEALLKEVQNLMNTKHALELEIATYRKMIEAEESRISKHQLADKSSVPQESSNKPAGK